MYNIHSIARRCIMQLNVPMTPAFDAAYAVAPAPPLVAMRLLTLMIQPSFLLGSCADSKTVRSLSSLTYLRVATAPSWTSRLLP